MKKNEWPYNASWFPKNPPQLLFFTFALFGLYWLVIEILFKIAEGNSWNFSTTLVIGTLIAIGAFVLLYVAGNDIFTQLLTDYFHKPPPPAEPPDLPPLRNYLTDALWGVLIHQDRPVPPKPVQELILDVGQELYDTIDIDPYRDVEEGTPRYEDQQKLALRAPEIGYRVITSAIQQFAAKL